MLKDQHICCNARRDCIILLWIEFNSAVLVTACVRWSDVVVGSMRSEAMGAQLTYPVENADSDGPSI